MIGYDESFDDNSIVPFFIKTLNDLSRGQVQFCDIDVEFSKVLTDFIKKYTTKSSQRANSIFTNDVFTIIYSYLSTLELKKKQGASSIQTSRHTAVRQEISIFSKFLSTIHENLPNKEISQNVKQELQKILAWFIIDNFVHNLDLISVARNNFQPQTSDDENILADETS